ncbi:MAG: response regulator [Candidatus Geothermincolales bacterium]
MNGRILIIDDEPQILRALELYLENEDFEVHVLEDPCRAVEKAEEIQPDLIILDIMMPPMDGIQVCRELRARSRTRLIPIIFLTARGSLEDKIQGLEAGGVDYVTKPFDHRELLARIRAHIRRSREEISSHTATGLPGAASVESEVKARLQRGDIFAALFVGLDHLKEYREAYGISGEEMVLRRVAGVLEEALNAHGGDGHFLGHPSYEEFLALCSPTGAAQVCREAVDRFEAMVHDFYQEQHRHRGMLTYYDYRGSLVKAPFLKLSIGGVMNTYRLVTTYDELSRWGAQALLKAKSLEKSGYVLEE